VPDRTTQARQQGTLGLGLDTFHDDRKPERAAEID